MIENLNINDVNNLHLVCRNLHQVANLHVHRSIRFCDYSAKQLESVFQSSRNFEELYFYEYDDDNLLSPAKFQSIEKYISSTGIHVKKLIIVGYKASTKVDRKIVQKLLTMLPNLENLELIIGLDGRIQSGISDRRKSSGSG